MRRWASTVDTTSVGLRSREAHAFHTMAATTDSGGINNNCTKHPRDALGPTR